MKNFYFCNDSIWGEYDSENIVSIERHLKHEDVKGEPNVDWATHIETKYFHDEEKYNMSKRYNIEHNKKFTEQELINSSRCKTYYLKPYLIKWLEENIKDKDGIKGWAVGTDACNSRSHAKFDIYFQRQKDAFAFIREFSVYKLPTRYFDYLNEVRKEIDFETLELKEIPYDTHKKK